MRNKRIYGTENYLVVCIVIIQSPRTRASIANKASWYNP